MFIQPGQITSTALPQQVRLDEETDPNLLYIGRAEMTALESAPVWRLSRFNLTTGALEICATLSAWSDHLTATYGVEG